MNTSKYKEGGFLEENIKKIHPIHRGITQERIIPYTHPSLLSKEKSIRLAIEFMCSMPNNLGAEYNKSDRSISEEKHIENIPFCKEFYQDRAEALISLAEKIDAYLLSGTEQHP